MIIEEDEASPYYELDKYKSPELRKIKKLMNSHKKCTCKDKLVVKS